MEIYWFDAIDRFYIKGRGIVYTGPSPIYVDKVKNTRWLEEFQEKPWAINHQEAKDKLWKVLGVESFAIPWISVGSPIGILVEPWEEEDATV